jgi:hypothetical protein
VITMILDEDDELDLEDLLKLGDEDAVPEQCN